MKKATMAGLCVLLAVLLASCAPPGGVKSGAAAGEALIRLMPDGTRGVLAIDLRRMMGTTGVATALQDPETREKYDEFVKTSGIDPLKDLSYAAFGFVGLPTDKVMDGGVIINMKYDPARLLGLIKERAPDAREEIYHGVTVYSNLDGDPSKPTTRAAFLDEAHVVLGGDKGVKGIIDVYQKRADPLTKNTEMSAILKRVDKSGIVWAAFAVPPDLLRKGIASAPQLKVLEGVTALTAAADHGGAMFRADILALGGTKEQNAGLASALNGFKGLGAMFAAQEPVVGEALNGIEISSGQDFTRISISLPQEVVDRFVKVAQSRAGEFMRKKAD